MKLIINFYKTFGTSESKYEYELCDMNRMSTIAYFHYPSAITDNLSALKSLDVYLETNNE